MTPLDPDPLYQPGPEYDDHGRGRPVMGYVVVAFLVVLVGVWLAWR
jgi:cytochrome c1